MGKKIRFPLKLAEGTEVRTLDELREHFDLQAILEYYKNGKLLTWLEDRYLEGEAEAIQALDESAPDFQRRLCEIFQVEYTGDDVDLEAIERRQERLKRLRSITDDAEYIQNIDRVAFDQEELADLLDEGEEKIYLCEEHFTVPASRKGVSYVGINNPAVHISGKVTEDVAELGIEFIEVNCDNLPVISEPGVENCQESSSMGELSPESIRAIVGSKIVTDHYALICKKECNDQAGEDVDVWYIHSLLTSEETPLAKEIADALQDGYDDFVVSGNEVYCRNRMSDRVKDDGFIIDLSQNKVIYSK